VDKPKKDKPCKHGSHSSWQDRNRKRKDQIVTSSGQTNDKLEEKEIKSSPKSAPIKIKKDSQKPSKTIERPKKKAKKVPRKRVAKKAVSHKPKPGKQELP
jgi:hypothetical protein